MRALAGLSDQTLYPLALATAVAGPPARLCPKFWNYFSDCVALEVASRPAMRARLNLAATDIAEPGFPLDLPSEELEVAAVALLAIGSADPQLEAAMREIAEALTLVLQDRLVPAVVPLRKKESIHASGMGRRAEAAQAGAAGRVQNDAQ